MMLTTARALSKPSQPQAAGPLPALKLPAGIDVEVFENRGTHTHVCSVLCKLPGPPRPWLQLLREVAPEGN